MVSLPIRRDPTLEAADREIERQAAQRNYVQVYLRPSDLGDPCGRKLYLKFRWAVPKEDIPAEKLKLFEDGFRTEDVMMARLRAVPGIEIWDKDEDGKQIPVMALDGHLKGRLDGVIRGLLQAPVTPHYLEIKCVNEKKFAELEKAVTEHGEKSALQAWDEIYYAQVQICCHLMDLTRAYLVVATPGARRDMAVRTDAQKSDALKLLARAEHILRSPHAPERIGGPTFYRCKWCEAFQICHGAEKPQRSCRSCMHSTLVADGKWRCEKHDRILSVDAQRAGCPDHRFLPSMINDTQTDVDGDVIIYKEWRDGGPNGF